jgi:aminocarboxymuconate-semialdehyde decarboxylase
MIGWVGASRVLLGSDYPYDMAMLDCVRHVRALAMSEAERASILGGQAEKLLARSARHAARPAAE